MQFFDWLGENQVPFAIVFTKADKLGVNACKTKVEDYKKELLKKWEELPPRVYNLFRKGHRQV